MRAQYLGAQTAGSRRCDALPPQRRCNREIRYQLPEKGDILASDCTQAIHTSEVWTVTESPSARPLGSDRSYKCRKLSRAFSRSVWLQHSQLALSKLRRTTTSLSSRSQSSPYRLVNTAANTKPPRRSGTSGQAATTALIPNDNNARRAVLAAPFDLSGQSDIARYTTRPQTGGVAC